MSYRLSRVLTLNRSFKNNSVWHCLSVPSDLTKLCGLLPDTFSRLQKNRGSEKKIVRDIIEELRDSASTVLDAVVSKLPKAFPQTVALSIERGFNRRLKS